MSSCEHVRFASHPFLLSSWPREFRSLARTSQCTSYNRQCARLHRQRSPRAQPKPQPQGEQCKSVRITCLAFVIMVTGGPWWSGGDLALVVGWDSVGLRFFCRQHAIVRLVSSYMYLTRALTMLMRSAPLPQRRQRRTRDNMQHVCHAGTRSTTIPVQVEPSDGWDCQRCGGVHGHTRK